MSCYICENLEAGDTLYASSDWDGGLGFDYIRDIQYCPVCGRKLAEQTEPTEPSTHDDCIDGKNDCVEIRGKIEIQKRTRTLYVEPYTINQYDRVITKDGEWHRIFYEECGEPCGHNKDKYAEPSTDCSWK